MLGRTVQVPENPSRIISLCPSQTLTLADLGCADRLAGITRFCIHPDSIWRSVTRIGGTKRVNYDTIESLQPDLIIAEKEENTLEMIQQLEQHYPVYVTDVTDISSSFDMVRRLGELTQTDAAASAINLDTERALGRIRPLPYTEVAYLIWREPWMVAGHDTFIQSVLEKCGFRNVFTSLPGRYPEISPKWLADANPAVVLLSDEPYPFAEKHIQEFRDILPHAEFRLVYGEFFSWYGSRMREADTYLNPLLDSLRNPEA